MSKERPILFSAPMVRAILDGKKTQTRRICKLNASGRVALAGRNWHCDDHGASLACPYGQPGDRLWVRETWQGPLVEDLDAYRAEPSGYNKPEFCEYAADGGAAPEFITMDDELVRRWRPSIHMPRWASRIQLEITAVRVERLQDISDEDSLAEGIYPTGTGLYPGSAKAEYRKLWETINGADSWQSTPWVWVVEFKRVT